MLTRVFLNPDRHEKLPDMALHMFGRMNQKTQNRRWKLSSTHRSNLGLNAFIHGSKFTQRQVHLKMERPNQISACSGGNSLLALTFEARQLTCVQGLAA